MIERKKASAEIGVFGGSGFYSFLENVEEHDIVTPYGRASDKVHIGEIGEYKVAFLPRHGAKHQYPPHMINYRANLDAMKQLGVTRIIAPCACGSLQTHIKPGEFVICDQFIDRTWGRQDTFYDGPVATHVSAADPYCPELAEIAINTAEELGITVHKKGTVVVIQGPRFSTRAESKWYQSQGWEVINMTQYPEAYLARELEICYVSIALITDYDVGLEGEPDIKPVSAGDIIKILQQNNDKVRKLLFEMIPKIPVERDCICSNALAGAKLE